VPSVIRAGRGSDGHVELTGAVWRTSSYSGNGGITCVEVAVNLPGLVAVRDSLSPSAVALVTGPGQWRSFTDQVRTGAFDLA
jgi:hypothetical protein